MATLVEIQERINKLYDRRNRLIHKKLDGRTQKWLAEKTGISQMRISLGLSANFRENEIRKIESTLDQ